ncbi:MAG: isoprenyl transferase [marine benthic group bacterium]|nr:isoprenyl transferase [Gemmatimonadota bacterium]
MAGTPELSRLLDEIRQADDVPRHVAVIMDGNGRWARDRGLPRWKGHREGMKAVRRCVQGSLQAGISHLTLYAFSRENWDRPPAEVRALMALLVEYVEREARDLVANGVRVTVFGDRDRLSAEAQSSVETLERTTSPGSALCLNLAISYGGRDEILGAARGLAEDAVSGRIDPADIDASSFERHLQTAGIPDPDLLIRTSGEMRISNFLLWQIAYSELYVTPVLWPEFGERELYEAILEYRRRERRFGRVGA